MELASSKAAPSRDSPLAALFITCDTDCSRFMSRMAHGSVFHNHPTSMICDHESQPSCCDSARNTAIGKHADILRID